MGKPGATLMISTLVVFLPASDLGMNPAHAKEIDKGDTPTISAFDGSFAATSDSIPEVDEDFILATTGYAEVEGGKLYYEVAGRGSALVLIHDGLLHRNTWDNQFQEYAKTRRVIRYDRRGYGLSEPPTQAYSNVEDLHALLQSLDVERATLIGSSSGGGLAIDYTLAHPDKVDGLVLVGAVVNGFGYSAHFAQRNQANSGPDRETTIERWMNDPYLIAPGNTATRQRARTLLAASPRNLSPRNHYYLQEPDFVALKRLPEIKVPTLVVVAEADIPDVHAHAGAIQAGIAGATRTVIPDAGHLVYLERPEAFNRVVLAFLSRFPGECVEESAGPARDNSGDGKKETAAASRQTGFAQVGGARLYFEMMGDGPALVLIHGGLLDCRMWDDQFEVLARHYRVIRYDVRQHGRSRSRRGPYADHDDLYALLKHLGIEQAHVVGLSLGGRIAVDFALAHPEMVGTLVPVSPGLSGYAFVAQDREENTAGYMAALGLGDLDEAVEFFQRSWTDGPQRTPGDVDPVVREKVRTMAADGIWRAQYQGQAQRLEPPAIGRLAEVRAPTLTIVGDLDMSDIHVISDLLATKVPGAKKVVIPGAAHMVNMEQPAEFNRLVLEFLARK